MITITKLHIATVTVMNFNILNFPALFMLVGNIGKLLEHEANKLRVLNYL